MSLTYKIDRANVFDLYNSLVASYGKDVYFIATPTNETYRINNSYNNYYNQEYLYKFCFSQDKIRMNDKTYTGNNLSCYYFRQDGTTELKNIGNSLTVHNNQLTYANVEIQRSNDVPMSIKNYGGVFTNEITILAFVVVAFVCVYWIVRNTFYKLR